MYWSFPVQIITGAVQRIVLAIRYVFQIAGLAETTVAPTFGANITIDNALGGRQRIVQSSNAAHTILAPTVGTIEGLQLELIFQNASGGAAGVATFNAAYHLQAGWVQPGNGAQRRIRFECDGAGVWHEAWRNTADVTT